MRKSSRQQGYKTLTNLARILSIFRDPTKSGRSLTEISNLSGMHPSKVSRMLMTLESEGFFERNADTGKYSLGMEFFELGMICATNFPLRKIVRPHIEQMAKELNLLVAWGIFRSNKVIIIDRVRDTNVDLFTYTMGLNSPLHCTSIGKLFLSYLSEEEQDNILQSIELRTFTDKTLVDPKLIKEQLKLIREKGYSTDQEEASEGLNGLAAPIRNETGNVVAAITIADEDSRRPADKLFQLSDLLKERALFISRQLGYRGNDSLHGF